MEEVEVKILEVDPKQVTAALAKMGAEKVFDSDVATLFLDTKDGLIHKRRDVLRLRKEEDRTELTYKEVKIGKDAKTAQEHTVEVSNIEIAIEILQKVGLNVTQKMNKHRVSYKTDDARFDIDTYKDEFSFIPPFMEIEASVDVIEKYAKQLGYQKKECLPWSTDELIAHYQSKKA
jgi:Adenylate cyclase, class 2 (thermophilic)